jgi:hypothetical protein
MNRERALKTVLVVVGLLCDVSSVFRRSPSFG